MSVSGEGRAESALTSPTPVSKVVSFSEYAVDASDTESESGSETSTVSSGDDIAATGNPVERALKSIRDFLKETSCYDMLPESFRLIVFDNELPITKAIQAMANNGNLCTPIYDPKKQQFDGMFNLNEITHLLCYYYGLHFRDKDSFDKFSVEIDSLQLKTLRTIEQAIEVPTPPRVYLHPGQSIYDACVALIQSHARRLPLIDHDDSGKEMYAGIIAQYRVLMFIAVNCPVECDTLNMSLSNLGLGSYIQRYGDSNKSVLRDTVTEDIADLKLSDNSINVIKDTSSGPSTSSLVDADPSNQDLSARFHPIATATMSSRVSDIVRLFSERNISAVPIIDENGIVLNMYETIDIVDLVVFNSYRTLDKTIGDALQQRPDEFDGILTCTPDTTLAEIMRFLADHRAHRFVIIESHDIYNSDNVLVRRRGELVGMLTLSDIMHFLVGQVNIKGPEIVGFGLHAVKASLGMD